MRSASRDVFSIAVVSDNPLQPCSENTIETCEFCGSGEDEFSRNCSRLCRGDVYEGLRRGWWVALLIGESEMEVKLKERVARGMQSKGRNTELHNFMSWNYINEEMLG